MLTNVYYIDAQQGFYYAILTPKTIRAFYLDSSGNTIYVTTYRWDLNTSWIIFQAPLSTRIYLREESYSMSTFATPSNWFSANPATSATPYYNISVSFPSPWGASQSQSVYPSKSESITRWFDGAKVIVRNTTTYSFSTSYSLTFQADTTSYVTAGRGYTAYIYVSANNGAPGATIGRSPQGLSGYNRAMYSSTADTYFCQGFYAINNMWITSASFTWDSTYAVWRITYSTSQLTYSDQSWGSTIAVQIDTNPTTTTHNNYACDNQIINRYIVSVSLTPSQPSVSFTADKTYTQSNNIITTDNNNKIYIAGALESLPYASFISSSTSSTYYVYSRSVSIVSQSRQDLSIL